MQSSILQRLRIFIDYLDLSDRRFAESIGVSASTLSSLFARDSDPNSSVIVSILNAYEIIETDWLILGKGEMLKSKEESPAVSNVKSGNPYYAVDFIGGFASLYNDQTTVPAYYIDYKPFNEANVMYVNLTGDSMKPELNHGDIIAIKEATSPIEYLPYGEIYAIVTDDFRTVKRISRSDKEGFIKLIPTNKQGGYVEQDIPTNMIRRIFHVLGSIKNL